MAFETGTATSIDDLIDKIRIFALAQGWTVNKYVSPVGGNDAQLYLQKNNVYANLDAQETVGNQTYHSVFQSMTQPWLALYMSTGFNTGSAINAQPGTSLNIHTRWLLAPMTTYYFFVDQDYFHVVVETIPGEFQHFGWGQVQKIGVYVGGYYGYGTNWSQSASTIDSHSNVQHSTPFDGTTIKTVDMSVLGTDVDSTFKWKAYTISGLLQERALGVNRLGIYEDLFNANPNTFNGLSVLNPMIAAHQMAGGLWTIVGHILDIRTLNIQAIAPGGTQSIGGDTWYVFPLQTKKDPLLLDNLPNSGYRGLAYKQVP